ncbi:MAG TPA: phosphoenolpyruvate--protein phosphotransferase [Anaeromyxobacteraceae bacterium]|nr:phosphoenolpyruvate--protein phosphotransferase [Anaeromyxobacteraceae bacterium]
MIGILVVSHSKKLAEGVEELVRAVGGPHLRFAAVGGLDAPGMPLGTDAQAVARAIAEVSSDEGVLVLMDLGSALLSARLALEFLPPEVRSRVLLCEAPLVEGAVAAAVQAALGSSIDKVASEARAALAAKAAELEQPSLPKREAAEEARPGAAPVREMRFTVRSRLGLHARPAARLVRAMGRFPEAHVELRNLSTGKGPVSATSITGVATLGLRQGHEAAATARGQKAEEALLALSDLFATSFGEAEDLLPSQPIPHPAGGAEQVLWGRSASPGAGMGPVRHLRSAAASEQAEPKVEGEWRRLEVALEKARAELLSARSALERKLDERSAGVLDAQILALEDESLLGPCRRLIGEGGEGAAPAFHLACARIAADYRAIEDDYLRGRAADVEDLERRVLAHLEAGSSPRLMPTEAGVLVADELAASEAAMLDPALVKGLCTAQGAPTSHAALLSRALGIPTVVGLGPEVLALEVGLPLLVDGAAGRVFVSPSPTLVADYARRAEEERGSRARARLDRLGKARTRDGRTVDVHANVSSLADAQAAVASGADGIGLLRTELAFQGRSAAPTEDEQYTFYRAVAEVLGDRPLTVRTLDAGGDKPLPFMAPAREANPFLGERAIRLSLAHPEIFKMQLRAVVRVAAESKLKVMFPMIATWPEWRRARLLLEEARDEVTRERGKAPLSLEVGMMVEVPSAALCAHAFAREADFFSIGTNDLVQYALAAERGNSRVAPLADPFEPAVLALVASATAAAHARGKRVAVCGEMASDARAIPLLVGLGVDELSVVASVVPEVKARVRELVEGDAREQARRALELASADEVRRLLDSGG